MATISITNYVNGAAIDATSVYLTDQASNLIAIRNTATGATTLAGPYGPITASADGVYEYNIDSLPTGTYEAYWKITNGSLAAYQIQTFSVDAASSVVDGVTLADIEREVSDRIGPYYDFTTLSGTTTTVRVSEITTTVDNQLDLVDLYLLRRGKSVDGSAIIGFLTGDRVRMVTDVANSNGTLTVDRAWTTPPIVDELFELHYLHPERELRRSILAGLKRCYLEDRAIILLTSYGTERNLTTSIPYLSDRNMVSRVQAGFSTTSLVLPVDIWWQTFLQGGDVFIKMAMYYFPYSLYVTTLRPAFSYVNGVTNLSGPNDDDDVLNIDLNYAAVSAHLAAWKRCRERLLTAAQMGFRPTLPEVVKEFNKASAQVTTARPGRFELDHPFPEMWGWV